MLTVTGAQSQVKPKQEIKEIFVMGAGGVGFYLATILARENGGRKLTVWDDDTFEGGQGYKRLPVPTDPKQKKVNFLAGFVSMSMGDVPPNIVGARITVDGIKDVDLSHVLVVDCTDMALEPRQKIWEAFSQAGAKAIRVSYDGNGMVVVQPGLPFNDQIAGGGYTRVPSLAQSFTAAGLGAQIVHQILEDKPWTPVAINVQEV